MTSLSHFGSRKRLQVFVLATVRDSHVLTLSVGAASADNESRCMERILCWQWSIAKPCYAADMRSDMSVSSIASVSQSLRLEFSSFVISISLSISSLDFHRLLVALERSLHDCLFASFARGLLTALVQQHVQEGIQHLTFS